MFSTPAYHITPINTRQNNSTEGQEESSGGTEVYDVLNGTTTALGNETSSGESVEEVIVAKKASE